MRTISLLALLAGAALCLLFTIAPADARQHQQRVDPTTCNDCTCCTAASGVCCQALDQSFAFCTYNQPGACDITPTRRNVFNKEQQQHQQHKKAEVVRHLPSRDDDGPPQVPDPDCINTCNFNYQNASNTCAAIGQCFGPSPPVQPPWCPPNQARCLKRRIAAAIVDRRSHPAKDDGDDPAACACYAQIEATQSSCISACPLIANPDNQVTHRTAPATAHKKRNNRRAHHKE